MSSVVYSCSYRPWRRDFHEFGRLQPFLSTLTGEFSGVRSFTAVLIDFDRRIFRSSVVYSRSYRPRRGDFHEFGRLQPFLSTLAGGFS
ncbi:hypothetical protein [Neobacillus niacini]|uniref:hypothetical protein n=1 Tax=Neobacillus niacini TaxID=86668 RepID=UPI0021CB93D1|nr:hypothetical protein [Neobacillus niacini]MCM3766441.1 hypothetical protein [Neobacillus niacini]